MKLIIFICLKYVSIVFGVLLLLGALNTKGKIENEELLMILVAMCGVLLAIYFQGEQKRESK
ncbi:hypothetical protein PMSD_05035 [Paenibacillus macquariensis subsp. defensor]|nr:hypothetical protein PMSD_05035 [Paenibacillus macquariensis subsp. defensor]